MVLLQPSPCRGGARCEHKEIDNSEPQLLSNLIKGDVCPILLTIVFVFAFDPKRAAASEDAPSRNML